MCSRHPVSNRASCKFNACQRNPTGTLSGVQGAGEAEPAQKQPTVTDCAVYTSSEPARQQSVTQLCHFCHHSRGVVKSNRNPGASSATLSITHSEQYPCWPHCLPGWCPGWCSAPAAQGLCRITPPGLPPAVTPISDP